MKGQLRIMSLDKNEPVVSYSDIKIKSFPIGESVSLLKTTIFEVKSILRCPYVLTSCCKTLGLKLPRHQTLTALIPR